MKIIFIKIGRLISVVLPNRLVKKVVSVRNYVRTGYLTRNINDIGTNTYFLEDTILIGARFITIGDNTSFGRRLVLAARQAPNLMTTPNIEIGNNVRIGDDCHITSINHIKIGNDVLFGRQITVTDNSHGRSHDLGIAPTDRPLYSKGPVTIGNRVWIGDKSTLLPGVAIGDDVIIGANSVVTKDIPNGCVAVGNPARIINIQK